MAVIFKKAGTQFLICTHVIGYELLVGSRVPPLSAVCIGTEAQPLGTERHCKIPMFEPGVVVKGVRREGGPSS